MAVLTIAERRRALHPRVGVGNDTPVWLKPRRTIWGPTLDNRYHGYPACRSYAGALKKAEALSRQIRAREAVLVNVRAILAARRGRGFRSRWIIAGRQHAVTYVAPGRSFFTEGAAVHFPSRAKSGDARQGLALDMHRDRAKAALRALIEGAAA